jgi:hypothetical protein
VTESTSRGTSRLTRLGRSVIGAQFMLAVAIIVYAGFHDFNDVFAGSPSAVATGIVGSCEAAEGYRPCDVALVELNPGRYRIATSVASIELRVNLKTHGPARARTLLVRAAPPGKLRLDIQSDDGGVSGRPIDLNASAGRVATVLPASMSIALSFRSNVDQGRAPIVIDELGVFEESRGLFSDVRPFFPAIPPVRYHGRLVPRAVARLCLFTVVAALFLPITRLTRITPVVLGVVCFSLCLLDLAVLFSPYSARDLRVVYAGGALQEPAGANLNGGLWQGFRLLQGKGLTLADGVVPWERMPGYGLFCALAGALFGHRTLLDVAMSTVLLQTIFYSAALAAFAWAAGLLLSPAAVWAVGVLIAWLPKQLGLTQVDTIIAPAALLILAALCLRLNASRDGRRIPIAIDVGVHATFALWFVLRPDVLPGWLFISLYLHRRNWRRLLIPVVLFLAIGVTWGAYKTRYNREFTFTTTSAGASLFCGLWEVPSRFRFAQACTDERYFEWIRENTPYQVQTAAANSFATREVLKFWLTYPGHFVVMVCHKMMRTLDGDLWPGYPTELQVFVFGTVRRYWLVSALLTILAVCVVTGYQRERTLLLAWPLLLNAPLFWVMFSSLGRFYSGVGVALVAAAVAPLFERPFYASVSARPWRTASVLVCAGVVAVTAWPLHDWLLRNEAFHYWTPFLDPSASRLRAFK